MNDVAKVASAPSSLEARLNEARKAAQLLDAKRIEAAQLRELEELDLYIKHEGSPGSAPDKLGTRGIDYEIVRTTEGCFVLALRDATHFRKFSALTPEEIKVDANWVHFILPHVVHPDPATFAKLIEKRAGLVGELAAPITRLHAAKEERFEKK
jgi:hypothetical protein